MIQAAHLPNATTAGVFPAARIGFNRKPDLAVEDGVAALKAGIQPTTRAFVNHFHTSGPRALALLWKLEYHKLVGSLVRGKREVFV